MTHGAHTRSAVDTVSVFAFMVLGTLLTQELLSLTLPWHTLTLTMLGGYVLADFTSGLVHFFGDTFGSVHTPLIGKMFIYPFREHHTDQAAITHHNFFVTNGHNCLVSLPVMMIMHLWIFPQAQKNFLWATVFSLGFFLVMSVFATNQIHKWAHMKKPPRIVRLLQRLRIILNPKHHALHHTAPYTSHFCITTGWLNPILEKAHFFKSIRKIGLKK